MPSVVATAALVPVQPAATSATVPPPLAAQLGTGFVALPAGTAPEVGTPPPRTYNDNDWGWWIVYNK